MRALKRKRKKQRGKTSPRTRKYKNPYAFRLLPWRARARGQTFRNSGWKCAQLRAHARQVGGDVAHAGERERGSQARGKRRAIGGIERERGGGKQGEETRTWNDGKRAIASRSRASEGALKATMAAPAYKHVEMTDRGRLRVASPASPDRSSRIRADTSWRSGPTGFAGPDRPRVPFGTRNRRVCHDDPAGDRLVNVCRHIGSRESARERRATGKRDARSYEREGRGRRRRGIQELTRVVYV